MFVSATPVIHAAEPHSIFARHALDTSNEETQPRQPVS